VTLAVGAAALLLTVSLASHASSAAADVPVAVALDWTHLLAAGIWTGGLLALALAAMPSARDLASRDLNAAADTAAALTRAFSNAAQICMLAVLATGSYAVLIHLEVFSDLKASWGVELVVKLALWATVLLVAGANTLAIMPRMSARAASVTARLAACGDLASAVRFELALAAALVSIAAVLAGTAPPDQLV
jgi:copper transport protein